MNHLTPDRLEEILELAPTVRIAVIGDLMLDTYLIGSVSRISPEAPVPVVTVREEQHALGGAANVAANVVAIGAQCTAVGFVGLDSPGDAMVSMLTMLPVRALLVERSDRITTTKTRVMAGTHQVVRYDRERDDCLPDACLDGISASIPAALEDADALVLADYNKGVLAPRVIRAAVEAARRRGIPVIVDPKLRNVFDYRGATLMKPNVFELVRAIGATVESLDDASLEEARTRFGCAHLLVTLGAEGMALSSEGMPAMRIPSVARGVLDVSGAGDTVSACMAIAVAAGASMQEAAVFANLAAGIEVGKRGVSTVKPDELRDVVRLEVGEPAGVP